MTAEEGGNGFSSTLNPRLLPAYSLPCENFHRIPSSTGSSSSSPWFTRLWNQAILGNLYPMKSCGDFRDTNPKASCQWGRHHNAVTWMKGGLWQSLLENFGVG